MGNGIDASVEENASEIISEKERILLSGMEKPDKAEVLAQYYSGKGLNCAECVLLACIDIFEMPLPPEIVGLATGFGGGMGRTRNSCGAVSGAVMALGTKKGRTPFLEESGRVVSSDMRPFGAMVTEIQENFGSIICRDLTDPKIQLKGREKKSCHQIIGYCARKVAEYLLIEDEKE